MHRKAVSLSLLTAALGIVGVVAAVRAQDSAPPTGSHVGLLAQDTGSGRSVLVDGSSRSSSRKQQPATITPRVFGGEDGSLSDSGADPVEAAGEGFVPSSARDPAPVVESSGDDPATSFGGHPFGSPPPRGSYRAADSRFGETTTSDDIATRPGATTSPSVATADVEPLKITTQAPRIRIETTGPKAIVIGKDAQYVVTMINDGDTVGSAVTVQLGFPSTVDVADRQAAQGDIELGRVGNRQAINWTVDQLGPRSQTKLELTVRPRTSEPVDMTVSWMFQPIHSSATVEVQEPQLEVKLTGVSEMRYGEEALYVIAVTNPGTGAAENVSIDLSLGERVESMDLGTLRAGQSKELEFPLTAAAAGVIDIKVVAKGAGSLRSEDASQVTVRRAALQVEVAAPTIKYAGSQAAFRVTVSNTGDAAAEDVVAGVALPAGAEYLSGLQGAKLSRGQLSWAVGSLAAGARRTYDVVCVLNQAGDNRLEALATDATKLTAQGAASVRVEALADLKLLVNDPKGPIPVGQSVVYEIVIVNRGSKAADNVRVVGQFSAGIDPVQIEGGRGEMSEDGQVLFEPISGLAPGKTVKLQITAKASSAGNHRFRAQVTCDEPDTNLVAEDTTKYFGESATASPAQSPRVESARQPTPAPRKLDVRR